MRRFRWAAVVAIALGGVAVAEDIPVQGSDTRFPSKMEVTVSYQPVKLALTGAALRQSRGINVYSVASYLQEGAKVKSAEQLVAVEAVKVLHLVLERNLDGATLFEGVRDGVRRNHSIDSFHAELGQLERLLRGIDMTKGQTIVLTYVPQKGLRCQAAGKVDVTVNNPAFARAIWDSYLGPRNAGEALKAALISRLGG
jgi:hypothetical protein